MSLWQKPERQRDAEMWRNKSNEGDKTSRGESCGQSFKNAKNYNETIDTAL